MGLKKKSFGGWHLAGLYRSKQAFAIAVEKARQSFGQPRESWDQSNQGSSKQSLTIGRKPSFD
jgi:hypothetical protein